MAYIEKLIIINQLCDDIITNKNIETVISLGNVIREEDSCNILQKLQSNLLTTFYLVFKNNDAKWTSEEKLIIIEILGVIFYQTKLDKEIVFFNLLGFLLQETYDHESHKIKCLSEEFKLTVMSTVKFLLNSTTTDLTEKLYTKENGRKLCRMIYVVVEIATHEKYRKLRMEAIECLMALFKVHKDSDYSDLLVRKLVADSFFFFLPGVAICLRNVAVEDEKAGQDLIKISLKAMGRIISVLMQDYTIEDYSTASLEQAKQLALHYLNNCKTKSSETAEGSKNKLKEYMEGVRNQEWFIKSDNYLSKLLVGYKKLTQHPISKVRKELCEMCVLLVQQCRTTMLTSHRYLFEILIIISEDEDGEIGAIAKNGLEGLRELTGDSSNQNTFLMNEMISGFQETISEIPSIFNGIDDKEKLAVLKLTAAYINIIGKNVQLHGSFKEFLRIILHFCEFEVDISTFNTVVIQDLNYNEPISLDIWKNLKYLKEESIRNQFSYLSSVLVKNDLFESISDFLMSVFENEDERKETIFFLNELIAGMNEVQIEKKCDHIQAILRLYIDPVNWNIPLSVESDEYEEKLSLRSVRNNIQQSSLSVYGVGVMAKVLKREFRPFLLKTLFLILSRAGSKHPMIQSTGLVALRNLADGLDYPSVTALINGNMDYFCFYVERCLKNNDAKEDAFDVLEVVMNYGDKTTLVNLASIIEEVLVQSCDKYKQHRIDSYLRIFKVFLKCLMRWFEVNIPCHILKTRTQKKEEELKNFKVGGLDNVEEITDFSDDVMGKSAEELYKEDMERKNKKDKEVDEADVEVYKKPEPPYHIKLTVEILKRSLNFLSSKEDNRKLLVLEILRDGVEIIRDFEDELLPVVHLIWSPLVVRFKDINVPVIINYSYQLLNTLARNSKDFIRNRTAKDVLPNILDILSKLSKESLLKDKGSAYRYTQTYKLQLMILEELGYLITYIDLIDKDIERTMDVIFIYLSNKQPIPLQMAAVNFFRLVTKYDNSFLNKVTSWLKNDEENTEQMQNLKRICGDDENCPVIIE